MESAGTRLGTELLTTVRYRFGWVAVGGTDQMHACIAMDRMERGGRTELGKLARRARRTAHPGFPPLLPPRPSRVNEVRLL